MYHESVGNTGILLLNGTNATVTNSIYWNNTSPTSSVFTVGSANQMNRSGADIIAYCFSEVSGVSSFGSYTGTGSAGKAVTGLGFRPGFLMIKETSSTGNWAIVDGTRSPFGETAGDYLWMNLSDAEGGAVAYLTLDNDGFTINSGDSDTNASGQTYIYMAFKGSYSDYVSPLNTDGSIDSRVKANPEKGFSIVSWEGDGSSSAYVGTGLSSTAPLGMAIVKRRDSTSEWQVGHIGNQASNFAYHLELNSTAANSGSAPYFMGSQSSTDGSLLYLSGGSLASGGEYIAYCFSEVAGYSKFDSYTGTGSSGNSVTGLGFQPAFLMVKRTDAAEGWQMLDNTRNPVAPHNSLLEANQASAEITNSARDTTFDSDGFTINNTSNAMNASGGTYIYMAFADTRDAQFNFDASGNKNNWIPNNINSNASSESSYDIMTDVPTLTDENTANYCTWNPVDIYSTSYIPTYSDGNLKVSQGTRTYAWSTLGMSEGKWYAEIELDTHGSGIPTIGIALRNSSWTLKYTTYASNGNKIVNGSTTSYGSTYTAGDIIGIAFDADTGAVTFYKNNVSQGSISNSDLASNVAARIWTGHSGSTAANATWILNAGQQPFTYTPPTGFLPLNTYNLPDSTIVDGSEYMNTVLYTGNGTSQSITGVGFQPDFVWVKRRSAAASHILEDAVRGATQRLISNLTDAESTDSGSITSFDSDGFSVGSTAAVNSSAGTFVGWNWKANGSGSSISVGSIDGTNPTIASTTSANTTSGFSILTYAGSGGASDTLAHGLGIAPEFVIVFDRDSATFRSVYHIGVDATSPANYLMRLNTTDARLASSVYWNNTKPTASVVTIGTSSAINDTHNYLMYCFAPVEGFSSFGSYTGNGNATDGPFVYTGFRPAWVLLKRSDGAASWYLHDSVRDTYNQTTKSIYPNLNSAEDTGYLNLDLTSNGFKLRTNTSNNVSGGTYIYAAFAENPFKNALAR